MLLIWPPLNDTDRLVEMAQNDYLSFADLAGKSGMKAILKTAMEYQDIGGRRYHLRKAIEQNPANQERLLATDAKKFSSIMRKWSKFYTSAKLPNVP